MGRRRRPAPTWSTYLIKHGADVEARAAANDWGNQITSEPRAQYRPTGGLTPLLYAMRAGCVDCVKSLLKAGADIDRPTPDGVTPLMSAIDNLRFEIANFLLDQGANPHVADWWGRTPLYIAVDMRSFSNRFLIGAANTAAEGAAPPNQAAALRLARRLLDDGRESQHPAQHASAGPGRQQRPLHRRPADHRRHAAAARRDVVRLARPSSCCSSTARSSTCPMSWA